MSNWNDGDWNDGNWNDAAVLDLHRPTLTFRRTNMPTDSSYAGAYAHGPYLDIYVGTTKCDAEAYTGAQITVEALYGASEGGWTTPKTTGITPMDGTAHSYAIDYTDTDLGALPAGQYIFTLTATPGLVYRWKHHVLRT